MARADIKPLPSQQRLRKLFDYDPETGLLRWKAQPFVSRKETPQAYGFNNKCAGKIAGTIMKGRCKYLSVGIRTNGKFVTYLAHRVIWKWMNGEEPSECIDHVDGDKLNNRWVNLREATRGQNRHNMGLQKNNRSGVKGVCWERNMWKAYISVEGRQIRLGRFKSMDDAATVVTDARARLHGEFARSA